MTRRIFTFLGATAALAQQSGRPGYKDTPKLPDQKWLVHDSDRPTPRLVTPGATPGAPPSDAIVLFDGKDLSKWETLPTRAGRTIPWKVTDGYFETVPGAGGLRTKEKFGDIQLHIEWSAPSMVRGSSQGRGNSGVIIMERYEVQVLDSWDNPTYADGQAGAIYGQYPPLVNASRKPGEWQTYDIIFESPKFEGERIVKQPNATVLHNGVLLHHKQSWIAPMAHRTIAKFQAHGAEESLQLQDHDNPVRYRNIWVRRLKGYDEQ